MANAIVFEMKKIAKRAIFCRVEPSYYGSTWDKDISTYAASIRVRVHRHRETVWPNEFLLFIRHNEGVLRASGWYKYDRPRHCRHHSERIFNKSYKSLYDPQCFEGIIYDLFDSMGIAISDNPRKRPCTTN